MKSNNIYSFLGGLLIGSAVTYLITRFYNKKKLDDTFDEAFLEGQTDILKQQYDSALKDGEVMEPEEKAYHEMAKEFKEMIEEAKDPELVEEYLSNEYAEPNHDFDVKEIEIIDEEDYANNMFHYDKREFTLYDDDIIADEKDDVIDDEKYYFGDCSLRSYAEDGMVYIRNNRLNMDAAIELVDVDYVDAIMNITDTERNLIEREDGS